MYNNFFKNGQFSYCKHSKMYKTACGRTFINFSFKLYLLENKIGYFMLRIFPKIIRIQIIKNIYNQ